MSDITVNIVQSGAITVELQNAAGINASSQQPFVNVAANKSIPVVAGKYISDIHIIWKSGNPIISCSTEYFGEEIIATQTVGTNILAKLEKYFPYNENLLFTLTGGVVDIILNYATLQTGITNMNFPYTLPHRVI